MTPLGEPWRPLRGAAAHLWWAYYKVLKARDGVIAGQQKSNAVLCERPVAKQTTARATIAAPKTPQSRK
jgi:DNA-3-methyladenine glycosylase II